MSSEPKDRRLTAVRIMAAACVAMALMCVGLAVAWNQQREEAACWRVAAEFELFPETECGQTFWASSESQAGPPASGP